MESLFCLSLLHTPAGLMELALVLRNACFSFDPHYHPVPPVPLLSSRRPSLSLCLPPSHFVRNQTLTAIYSAALIPIRSFPSFLIQLSPVLIIAEGKAP